MTTVTPLSSTISSQSLFDEHGRLVPLAGDRVYSRVDRRYFQLVQPAIDFASVHGNVAKHLGTSELDGFVSASAFAARCERLRADALSEPAIAGLFSGVHVPFVLVAARGALELGTELEEQLLPAVGRAFKAAFPEYDFRNHAAGSIAGQLSVVEGTRYERLVAAHASRTVCGWYFPLAMTGFAIPDQRTLVARLPERLILGGPLEAAMALVGTPELLLQRDNYPNLLALTAVRPSDPKMFHFFEAYGWNLTYNQRSMIGTVSEYFAGGFTIID